MQLDVDLRLHFPHAVNNFMTDFPMYSRGIFAVARQSRGTDIVELLREYDFQKHSTEVNIRDHLYELLALLCLLPSANTRHKAKRSSAQLVNSFICFKQQQTSIDLILSEKLQKQPKKNSFFLCLCTTESPGIFYLILYVKAM